MRTILLAGVALALSACGGGADSTNEANVLADDNLMMDQNLMVDPNLSVDGMNAVGANTAMDSNTQNMMQKDATTNDPDTNLANGL